MSASRVFHTGRYGDARSGRVLTDLEVVERKSGPAIHVEGAGVPRCRFSTRCVSQGRLHVFTYRDTYVRVYRYVRTSI